MGNGGVGNQLMRGFPLSFLEKYPFMAFEANSAQRKTQDDPYWYAARSKYGMGAIMGYHTQQTLPVYAMLAKEYMICDRWYDRTRAPPSPTASTISAAISRRTPRASRSVTTAPVRCACCAPAPFRTP